MGPLLLWLFLSYAMVLAVGLVLFREGYLVVGLLLLVGFPVLRIALRFREGGGYRLIGEAGRISGSLGERGGRATRGENGAWFRLCFVGEVLTVVAIYALYFLGPLVDAAR